MKEPVYPRKSALIHAPIAEAFQRAPVEMQRDVDGGLVVLFDPDRPTMDPNDLKKETGGLADPRRMNHVCPFCSRDPMRWEIFSAHLPKCMFAYQSLHPKNFAGATRKDSP